MSWSQLAKMIVQAVVGWALLVAGVWAVVLALVFLAAHT